MSGVPVGVFRTSAPELTVREALELIAARLPAVTGCETVPLEAACGRILAKNLTTPRPLPPFDHAAVDGYAFRLADHAAAGGILPLGGRVAAGEPAMPLASGTAIRIFTGAPLPEGADVVAMQEDVVVLAGEEGGALLRVPPTAARAGGNIRRAGEEFAAGAAILPPGRRIGPAELALIASLGLAEVPVCEQLRVALFSTGSELVAPGSPCGASARYDSNRPMLAAMLARLGCLTRDFGIVRDDPAALRAVLAEAAAGQHVILTTGGASAGEEDHARASLAALGESQTWLLRMKPGRALVMGQIGGVPVLGLPGNPVAAMHAFIQIARPVLLRLAGAAAEPLQPLPVRAAFAHRKKPGRLEALRVRLARENGAPVLRLFGSDSSGWLSSLTEGDGLAVLSEEGGDVSPGDVIGFLPFAGLL